ncbi:uncharacterized protein EDB91DRAFT_1084062 [Suillus paluster]|uniref:uncharacterized protein n=1 Tax=Suillus paluster TaxID=48578 RepID=UPI001B882F01|nr:uncharacterized protein EDB91DRAFT_1084062 [Suillus paluster]KAG1734403.1 hypothetical protein EDB91DRAFT_1084062 [Suillus paluster]
MFLSVIYLECTVSSSTVTLRIFYLRSYSPSRTATNIKNLRPDLFSEVYHFSIGTGSLQRLEERDARSYSDIRLLVGSSTWDYCQGSHFTIPFIGVAIFGFGSITNLWRPKVTKRVIMTAGSSSAITTLQPANLSTHRQDVEEGNRALFPHHCLSSAVQKWRGGQLYHLLGDYGTILVIREVFWHVQFFST